MKRKGKEYKGMHFATNFLLALNIPTLILFLPK
jgi:hypothetical protein